MTHLEQLLSSLRAHIVRAEFSAAAAVSSQIEATLDAMTARPDPPTLHRLKSMAERNNSLIEAARRGIRSARCRVEEVRSAASGIQTYDGGGKRRDISLLGRTAGRF